MQTIAVIVPTLWRYHPFADFVNRLAQMDVVCQVIVVDNNSKSRPSVEWHTKIQFLDFGCNIYVNPSWNVGAYHASADILCFLNDDVVFDTSIMSILAQKMQPDQGLFGYVESTAETAPRLVAHTNQLPQGFGQLFFLHQSNFVPVPAELLVHCGDNFLFDILKKRYNQNYLIVGLDFHGSKGTSSSSFTHLHVCECIFYENLRKIMDLPEASTQGSFPIV